MEIKKEMIFGKIPRITVEVAFIALAIYFLKDLLDLFILTFLFSYIIYNLQSYIVSKTRIPKTLVIVCLYVIISWIIGFFIYKYVPEIIREVKQIVWEISRFEVPHRWTKYINFVSKQVDITKVYDTFTNALVSTGKLVVQGSINLFISLILSMFFVLDKDKITDLLSKFKKSKVSRIYSHFEYFGTNFINSFGKVVQAQLLIALTNGILSTIILWILGFPQLIGLGFMIFVLSFIPVAGVIVSLIPLCLIAFSIGGVVKLISVIVMIALLHCLESYILNPKLMADKTSLPIFVIFLILIIGKHFLGVWGLLFGIPLFIFILDIIDVRVSEKPKNKEE